MENLSLSLCMIVKNEEHCIARCLNSVKDIVDEMIIVDTGSTDKTIEICKSFGAHVLHYEWNENFAEARNYGIERATGDWILWMDADEELVASQPIQLAELLPETSLIAWVHLVNYIGNETNENDAFHIGHTRFFRNHTGIQFISPIHELLNVAEQFPDYDLQLAPTLPIKIFHYGYMNDYVDNKQKSERNVRLLEQELKKDDHSPWIKYHIASEYYRIKEYQKAFEYLNLAIVHFLEEKKAPPSLLYKLKYSILLTLGSIEGAWQGIDKAIQMYPDYVDLYFYKGVIYFLKGKVSEALPIFEQCIEMGEDNIKHLTLKGVGSFHALYYIGLCHQHHGDYEQATNAFESVLALCPDYQHAIEALQELSTLHTPERV